MLGRLLGDDSAESDARLVISLNPTWHRGHARLGAALFKSIENGTPLDRTAAAVEAAKALSRSIQLGAGNDVRDMLLQLIKQESGSVDDVPDNAKTSPTTQRSRSYNNLSNHQGSIYNPALLHSQGGSNNGLSISTDAMASLLQRLRREETVNQKFGHRAPHLASQDNDMGCPPGLTSAERIDRYVDALACYDIPAEDESASDAERRACNKYYNGVMRAALKHLSAKEMSQLEGQLISKAVSDWGRTQRALMLASSPPLKVSFAKSHSPRATTSPSGAHSSPGYATNASPSSGLATASGSRSSPMHPPTSSPASAAVSPSAVASNASPPMLKSQSHNGILLGSGSKERRESLTQMRHHVNNSAYPHQHHHHRYPSQGGGSAHGPASGAAERQARHRLSISPKDPIATAAVNAIRRASIRGDASSMLAQQREASNVPAALVPNVSRSASVGRSFTSNVRASAPAAGGRPDTFGSGPPASAPVNNAVLSGAGAFQQHQHQRLHHARERFDIQHHDLTEAASSDASDHAGQRAVSDQREGQDAGARSRTGGRVASSRSNGGSAAVSSGANSAGAGVGRTSPMPTAGSIASTIAAARRGSSLPPGSNSSSSITGNGSGSGSGPGRPAQRHQREQQQQQQHRDREGSVQGSASGSEAAHTGSPSSESEVLGSSNSNSQAADPGTNQTGNSVPPVPSPYAADNNDAISSIKAGGSHRRGTVKAINLGASPRTPVPVNGVRDSASHQHAHSSPPPTASLLQQQSPLAVSPRPPHLQHRPAQKRSSVVSPATSTTAGAPPSIDPSTISTGAAAAATTSPANSPTSSTRDARDISRLVPGRVDFTPGQATLHAAAVVASHSRLKTAAYMQKKHSYGSLNKKK